MRARLRKSTGKRQKSLRYGRAKCLKGSKRAEQGCKPYSALKAFDKHIRQRFLRPLTSARTMPFTRQALRKPPARAFSVRLAAHSHCNTQYCCFGFAAIHRKLCSLRVRSNATLLHRVCSAPRRVASTSRGTISGGKGQKQRVCVRPGRPFSSISIHKKVRFSLFPLNEKRPPNNVLGGRFLFFS